MEKPKMSKESIKSSFKTKTFKAGGYSIIAAVAVIAIAVIINLIVGKLPSNFTKLDVTSNKLFDFSEQTQTLVKGLDEKIDIYWISQSGYEDANLGTLLEKYQDMNKNVTVTKKDPAIYPNFATQYTNEDIYNNSLIVVCGDRSKYVNFYEIYVYDYTNYYVDGSYTTSFNGESALTSAIDYVTNDNFPVAYTLTGHGESNMDAEILKSIDLQNIATQDLNLISSGNIPEDASCLIIVSPKKDITAEEKDAISEYLKNGGDMILLTDYTEDDMPNLMEIMEYYGVTPVNGIIVEGDANYCLKNYSYYLLPDLDLHEITAPLKEKNYFVLLPVTHGIEISDRTRDTETVTPLLTTSDKSFSKIAGYAMSTYEKEEGDIDGPFSVAVAISETVGDGATNIVWFGTSNLLQSKINETVAGGNHDMILNSIAWACDRQGSISIHSKSLETEYLTINSFDSAVISLVLVGVIPLAFIGICIYVVVRRKRK
ncbi:MAG: GldG family protein [Lachnospiraceae bacterium]|nr:GldG family protein [Lachnospiraceae bacterium]